MKPLVVTALALPLLAACATIGPAAPASAACSNSALQQFVGQPATADLGARVLAASGAKTLQWIEAGTMVTMEFREGRVRIYLDEQNRVQRLSCG
jgi:hypothetical protein